MYTIHRQRTIGAPAAGASSSFPYNSQIVVGVVGVRMVSCVVDVLVRQNVLIVVILLSFWVFLYPLRMRCLYSFPMVFVAAHVLW